MVRDSRERSAFCRLERIGREDLHFRDCGVPGDSASQVLGNATPQSDRRGVEHDHVGHIWRRLRALRQHDLANRDATEYDWTRHGGEEKPFRADALQVFASEHDPKLAHVARLPVTGDAGLDPRRANLFQEYVVKRRLLPHHTLDRGAAVPRLHVGDGAV